MNVRVKPGKYVVAVSGGVDSMMLLDMLRRMPDVVLTVAHFEHGIRADSDEDRLLVEQAAKKYGLPFVFERGHLGPGVSEATARQARYHFLRRVKEQAGADSIITAHHQDDLLETTIINLLRGTGRRGLSALSSQPDVIRPLLHTYKDEILRYARTHQIVWHEDSTNDDETYLRNYIRKQIVPRLGDPGKRALLAQINRAETSNKVIDDALAKLLLPKSKRLPRRQFIMLPHEVAREVMAAWLRQNGFADFDRTMIERLVTTAKVAAPGKVADINRNLILRIGRVDLEVSQRGL